MNSTSTLSTKPLEYPAMDYAVLRGEGLGHLEKMAGGSWTDFNAHDPGITILEQLCYAITDLGYRLAYDLPDLLATDSEDEAPYGSLYSPARILTCHPVTPTDLRKLVIDVKGVKNAWVEIVDQGERTVGTPQLHYRSGGKEIGLLANALTTEPVSLKGLYRVLIEKSEIEDLDGNLVRREVARRLQANRALCEDFEEIRVLDTQDVQVIADIAIDSVDNAEDVLVAIYEKLSLYISPLIPFRSLRELLAAGKPVDEVFDGPLLEHGFIDTEELNRLTRKTELRASDLIREIMAAPGVRAVRDIHIAAGGEPESWLLKLDSAKTPGLDLERSRIRLEKDGIEVSLNTTNVIAGYKKKLAAFARSAPSAREQDLAPPRGRDRRLGDYYSIQHQFPDAYGIGEMGLPASASLDRQARAKQLKAYLLFFDQLLANYFAQLENAKTLLSFQGDVSRTYFSQTIDDARLGLAGIRKGEIAEHTARLRRITENPYLAPEETAPATDFSRRNRFLNHLLARFGEQLTDYSLILHDLMPEGGMSADEKLARDKQAFLADYPRISSARGAGFDYTAPNVDPTGANISGLEKRIRLALGIEGEPAASLAGGDKEGFYLVEHILLRPMEGDEHQEVPLLTGASHKDPYSLQVSFLFPDELPRFKNAAFRQFIEQTIRRETPVHLTPYVHWLDNAAMAKFEAAYRNWLEKRREHWRGKYGL
uniref:Uncharacterized protein n=1 Tax=Candidatus Kentrum sp. UNK TaxID=2126344 RepID=A0A451A132_9GAMM|nr:MAG: hypothetical protein BECKUNK1418G_GA0071005_100849 [Candidatus Kentron sp. UNK]VFK68770.1 MAG: hypothetical protein BECKUNK1418H_GA0071006_10067 [Candidatus Kentron sp. UNK]